MGQEDCNTKGRKYQQIGLCERKEIERGLRRGYSIGSIARALGRSKSSIGREIKRGSVIQRIEIRSNSKRIDIPLEVTRSVYFADVGQRVKAERGGQRGGKYKLLQDPPLVSYIEDRILKDKWSPDAVIGDLKANGSRFKTTVCFKTVYNYIDKGLMRVKNLDLLMKVRMSPRKGYKPERKRVLGDSIDLRPNITDRTVFGHWEGDTVVGKDGNGAILTLVERKTGNGLAVALKDRSAAAVVEAFKRLAAYRPLFKTITFDNGSEFAGVSGIEGFHSYFAHPYSAYERGINENYNRMLRRFLPKGTDFTGMNQDILNRIAHAVNSLPRKRLNYKSAEKTFAEEVTAIQ
jgi:IS30 family transposase